jgi:hypothetical protein
LVLSEQAVFHETTNGPFIRTETVWANWAPEENNSQGISLFVNRVDKAVAKILFFRKGDKNEKKT